jgi:hypothetical protein
MTFTCALWTYNGPYGPRNAGAIWITNGQKQFVKTSKSGQANTALLWCVVAAPAQPTGAVTSASLNSLHLHTVNWNAAISRVVCG